MKLLLMRGSARRAVAVVAAALAVSATAALAAPAMALASVGHLSCYQGDTRVDRDYDDIKSLLNDASSASGKVTIDLYEDWTIWERIYVREGQRCTLNLNGHMIDRGIASTSWWGTWEGQAIRVAYGADLTINGGDASITHPGTLLDNGYFWKSDLKGSTVIKGGLITGSAGDAESEENEDPNSGAVGGEGANNIIINDVTIAGNVADNNLFNDASGAGITARSGKLELNNTKIMYNHSEGTAGGIYTLCDDVSLADCVVQKNYADDDGGGIYAYSDGLFELKNTKVTGNKTKDNGGGVFQRTIKGELKLDNSTIERNIAEDDGGGIYQYLDGSKITLVNKSMVSNNLANGNGGGIYINDHCTLKIESESSVISNLAKKNGGGVFVDDNDVSITLDNASITTNKANKAGGGIYHNARDGEVKLSNGSMINENEAKDGDGGGIYDYYNGTRFILNSRSAIFGNIASKNGGGLYLNDEASISMNDGSTIDYNQAGESGGGVFSDDDTTSIKLAGGSSVAYNKAKKNGGGLCLADSTNISLEASHIKGNEAGHDGGGVYLGFAGYGYSMNVAIDMNLKSSISDNKAVEAGGGIFDYIREKDWPWDGGTFTLRSADKTAVIQNNNGGKYGGGVYIYRDDADSMEGVTIKDNTANEGGGIFYQDSQATLKDVEVSGNTAQESAGGVYVWHDAKLTLKGKIVVQDNTQLGEKSNLLFDANDTVIKSDSSDALSKDSRIGVTVKGFKDTDSRVQLTTAGFLDRIGDDYKDAIFADSPYRCVVFDNKCLYYERSAANFALEITDANNKVVTRSVEAGTEVKLSSSDYAPAGCVVDYWTVDGLGETHKLEPVDGVTTFTMPKNNVRVLVRYKEALSEASISLRDSVTWADLGLYPRRANVSALSLKGTAGSSYGLTTSDEIRKVVWVSGGSLETNDAGQKTVTYTVDMSQMVLEGYGLKCEPSALRGIAANVSTKFATVEDAQVTAQPNDQGGIIITIKATFDEPATAVTINAVNVNKASADSFDTVVQQVSNLKDTSDGSLVSAAGNEASAENGTVTIKAPSEPGWKFNSWRNLPDGAVEDSSTHAITMPVDIAAGAQIEATYEPLASAVAIQVGELKVGEAFPTSIESCKVAGANERDITSFMSDAKLSWIKADGSSAGSTVEGDTLYECTISVAGDAAGYLYGFDSSVYTTVNGDMATASFGKDVTASSVSYIVCSDSDGRYDSLVSNYPITGVHEASDIADSLPTEAYYKLKSGTILSASVTWDTSTVDETLDSGSFDVKGSFEDCNGDTHEVTQTLFIIELCAPEASYETATDDSGNQTVTLTAGEGWQGDVDYTIHYALLRGDEIDLKDLDFDDFDVYTEPVVLQSGQLMIAYADVTLTNSVKRTLAGIYGRTLDVANFTLDSKSVAYGTAPAGTLTMDGVTLKAGEDYIIECDSTATVGKAYGLICSIDEDLDYGYKFFEYTVVPTKVTGVATKTKGKKKAKLSWNKHKAQTDGFQVRYAASKAKLAKNKGKAAKVKNAGAKSYTAKKLKSGKKYFFKVRAYKVVDGKTYWGAWSKVKAVKVK